MERRKFSREFKLEAGRYRGAGGRDLDLHVNVLRKWVREQSADPLQAFPGHGQMKPEQLESRSCDARSPSSRRSATS